MIARRASVLFCVLLVTFLSALALPAQADDYQITLDEVHLFVDKTLVPVGQDIECWAWCDYTLALPQGEEEELEAGGEGDVYVKEIYTWNWDGGNPTSIEGDHHYKVNYAEPGEYTIQVTCNVELRRVGTDELLASDGPKDKSASVTIVKVDKIKYSFDDSTFVDFPPEGICVGKGTTLYFMAISNPAGQNWPSDQPVWSGTAGVTGTGDEKSKTFSTASPGPASYYTVVAKCGTDDGVTGKVYVTDLDAGDIDSKRTSAPAEGTAYEARSTEHLELGGTFAFELDTGGYRLPLNLRWEVWETSGIHSVVGTGQAVPSRIS